MPSSPWSNTGVDREADPQLVGRRVDERGGHPHAFVELDDGQQLGHLDGERRVRRLAGDREAVHRAPPDTVCQSSASDRHVEQRGRG